MLKSLSRSLVMLFVVFTGISLAENWIQLFNGEDLNDWIPKVRGHEAGVNYADTWRVVDGRLVVSYDQYTPEDLINMDGKKKKTFDRFGHLFYKTPFSHYRLRAEYRFVGEQLPNSPEWAYRNNGLMLHCQSPESMDVMQKFPISIEAQLLGGNGTDERPTLSLFTPGCSVYTNGVLVKGSIKAQNSGTHHGDQWVTVEVEVRGNEVIRHLIGDTLVMEYNSPEYDPKSEDVKHLGITEALKISEGYISIQSETHPTEFRKIELLELTP